MFIEGWEASLKHYHYAWCEFVLPYYDDREEMYVNNVLKSCGNYVKTIAYLT